MRASNQESRPAHDDIDHELRRAIDLLCQARHVVVFTGAGVSAESGVPTFRDQDGFWSRFPPEQFAHWRGLEQLIQQKPLLVGEFVIELLRPILAAQPNPAHDAIATLEKRDKAVTVVTQNIDGLHQRAGSTRVIEIHGSLFETVYVGRSIDTIRHLTVDALLSTIKDLETFLRSGQSDTSRFLRATRALFGSDSVGFYRPNIVLFGDMLPATSWGGALEAVTGCDCLLIVGTSQLVYPAASLPGVARSNGAKVIGVGLDPCICDVWLRGQAGALLPQLVANL